MVQPCIWFKEEPSQFSMGQTAQSLTCSIMEKPHTGLDECPRILLSCFRAMNSGGSGGRQGGGGKKSLPTPKPAASAGRPRPDVQEVHQNCKLALPPQQVSWHCTPSLPPQQSDSFLSTSASAWPILQSIVRTWHPVGGVWKIFPAVYHLVLLMTDRSDFFQNISGV